MKIFEEWDIRLPSYLSEDTAKELFQDLKDYPNNLGRIYTSLINGAYLYQGDGVRGLPMIHLPDTKIEQFPVLVISNTCDTDPENKRFDSPRLIYCPIVKLDRYRRFLESKKISSTRIDQYFASIRGQEITTRFYLPVGVGLNEECVAFLDNVINCSANELPAEDVKKNRIFSLSQYGWYILLIKLSIHFTRVREGVNRSHK